MSASGLTPTRMYHSSVYSSSTGVVYVIGGVDNNNDYSDVWTYDVNTLIWSSVTTNGGSFTTRDSFSAVLDTTSQIIYVFGGLRGTGSVSSSLWSFATPTGNINFLEVIICTLLFIFHDFLAATWSQLSPSGSIPPARKGHQAEINPSASAMYMFCGDDNNNPTYYSDIWLFDTSIGIP